jgi:hypothetical protein
MADVVVTVPKRLWPDWIEEGHLPGEEWDGESEYHFFGRGSRPTAYPIDRVYVVAHGMLRGYAPCVGIDIPVTGRARDRYSLFRLGPSHYHDGVPIGQTIIERFPQPLPDWWWPGATYGLVRHAGAVACTIPEPIRGFQGWRYRWWDRSVEVPFPTWMTKGVS